MKPINTFRDMLLALQEIPDHRLDAPIELYAEDHIQIIHAHDEVCLTEGVTPSLRCESLNLHAIVEWLVDELGMIDQIANAHGYVRENGEY